MSRLGTSRDLSHINEVETARLILSKLGVSLEDLGDGPGRRSDVPTFVTYIPQVARAVPVGTLKVYQTYWNRIIQVWGERLITDVSASQISELVEYVKTIAVQRRNSRGGRVAAEHLIAALRCIYKHAVADGIMRDWDNPAARVAKPRRLPSTRHALLDSRLDEISHVAATTGNDPALDALLIRLHIETACRRGGALSLQPSALDAEQCLIQLREKGGTVHWQPVSPTLMRCLIAHAESRGGLELPDRLLRYESGRPITSRRYDYLWRRLGNHLPWVAAQQISTHWLRHTTLTWVERNFGQAVARAYAHHTGRDHVAGTTAIYVEANVYEVATALAALTGEPHPLAIR